MTVIIPGGNCKAIAALGSAISERYLLRQIARFSPIALAETDVKIEGSELRLSRMTSQAENFSDLSTEIPEHVLATLRILAPEQRQQAFAFIEFLYQTQQSTLRQQATAPQKQSVFGQYAGRISTSADFDDPLPDAFWLGES